MPWMTVAIGGKGADVFEPSQAARAQFGVLHLHGIGLETLIDRPVFTRWLDELQLACVCPHGQRSWWGDRVRPEFDAKITPERYLLDLVVPFFRALVGALNIFNCLSQHARLPATATLAVGSMDFYDSRNVRFDRHLVKSERELDR